MSLQKEYDQIKDDYFDFLTEIKRVAEKLLSRHKIPVAFEISSRLKAFDSILEKNSSGRVSITKTITELNDLVGLRIVVLFPEYKDEVIKLFLDEFKPVEPYDPQEIIADKFGYSSAHLVLGIKDEWLKTPDWEDHLDKKVEVQIRTLSEHIWAETSHSLFYKREENIPTIISRDLYRLAAILEVVDEKMQGIKNSVEKHFEHIRKCPYQEILTMDLNPETFRRVMFKNSEGLYNLNDKNNKIFSSQIEKEYNILNANALDSILFDKIDLQSLDNDKYVDKVIKLLDSYKKAIDEKQKASDDL